MSIDKEFEHLKEKIKAETEDALMKALKSENWLNVYNIWVKDVQVKYYLEENYPDIAAKCKKVFNAHSELIATIGEHFHHTPGGIEF